MTTCYIVCTAPRRPGQPDLAGIIYFQRGLTQVRIYRGQPDSILDPKGFGAFFIAAFANAPGIVYLESPDQGQIKERLSAVAKISEIFDQVRAEALPRGASRDLIRKVAEEQWTT